MQCNAKQLQNISLTHLNLTVIFTFKSLNICNSFIVEANGRDLILTFVSFLSDYIEEKAEINWKYLEIQNRKQNYFFFWSHNAWMSLTVLKYSIKKILRNQKKKKTFRQRFVFMFK